MDLGGALIQCLMTSMWAVGSNIWNGGLRGKGAATSEPRTCGLTPMLSSGLHKGILRDQFLVRFELIAQQDIAWSHRLRVVGGHGSAPCDDARGLGCAAKDNMRAGRPDA
jgi:hypothetical protein